MVYRQNGYYRCTWSFIFSRPTVSDGHCVISSIFRHDDDYVNTEQVLKVQFCCKTQYFTFIPVPILRQRGVQLIVDLSREMNLGWYLDKWTVDMQRKSTIIIQSFNAHEFHFSINEQDYHFQLSIPENSMHSKFYSYEAFFEGVMTYIIANAPSISKFIETNTFTLTYLLLNFR